MCRAAARLLLTAGRAAIDRCLLTAGPTAAAVVGWDRQRDGRTDGRQLHRDLAPHIMRTVKKTEICNEMG